MLICMQEFVMTLTGLRTLKVDKPAEHSSLCSRAPRELPFRKAHFLLGEYESCTVGLFLHLNTCFQLSLGFDFVAAVVSSIFFSESPIMLVEKQYGLFLCFNFSVFTKYKSILSEIR